MRTTVVFIAAAITACGGETREETGTTRRDSAGVTIITHPAAALEDVWLRLGDPVLRIGSLDGEAAYLFDDVRAGHLFPDGRILVVDGGPNELRFFGADGTHLRTSGGEGEGPGEIERVQGLTISDSLVGVVENVRTSWFDTDGDFIRTDLTDLSTMQGLTDGRHTVGTARPLPGGAWFGPFGQAPPNPSPEGRPVQTFALWFPESLERMDTLAMHPSAMLYEHSGGLANAPFWPWMLARTGGPDGTIYVTSNQAFDIRQFDAAGRLGTIIRFDAPLLPLRQADIDEWKESQRAMVAGTPRAEDVERELAAAPLPDVLPPFGSFRVDQLGRLWAERWPRAGEERRFLVIATDGEYLGNVVIPTEVSQSLPGSWAPSQFAVLDAGVGHVLGVARNEFDVQYLQLYEIR